MEFERTIEEEMKKYGARIDRFYYCPYHPDGVIEKYRKDSIFRKPEPGMILKAANDMNISISKSVMVGDKESDRIKLPQLKSYVIKSRYVDRWDFENLKDPFCRHILPHN
jgi:histidinol phosphatase-like enzyme